jgi:hypothetical protein
MSGRWSRTHPAPTAAVRLNPWELDRPIALAQVLLYIRRQRGRSAVRDDHMIRFRPELTPTQRKQFFLD